MCGRALESEARVHRIVKQVHDKIDDHEKKRDAEKMEARETALLLKLRYPAPYLIRDV